MRYDDANKLFTSCDEVQLLKGDFDVVLIEINSFGMRSGGSLFDWTNDADYQQLFNGTVCEFRVL